MDLIILFTFNIKYDIIINGLNKFDKKPNERRNMAILSFRRIEKKYIVTEEQKRDLIAIISEHMDLDPFCKNESTYRIHPGYS